MRLLSLVSFFFNDTATTEIYTLSLHDALPIYFQMSLGLSPSLLCMMAWILAPRLERLLRTTNPPSVGMRELRELRDRKSTRLNSSHQIISYAVFCLKKKKNLTRLHTNLRLRCA